MKHLRRLLYLAIIFLLILVIAGSIGYCILFEVGVIESIYLSIVTMSSLSLEIRPSTDIQKVFVALYSIISIGVYLLFVSIFVAYIILHNKNLYKSKRSLNDQLLLNNQLLINNRLLNSL